ncbi:MAG: VCBS repeat-containing protein [Candidatus Zixiibacteriota bacterium]|nr:MAG: VCBS repeat-containing protein [candidate division Zixibacteria bacterium]
MDGADGAPHIDVTLDSDGNVLVAGITRSTDFPTTPGAFQSDIAGEEDIFIAKFDRNMTTLLAATLLGGTQSDQYPRICTDNAGNVFVAGATESTDFPITFGAYDLGLSGSSDLFISKLDGSLSTIVASTYLGGDGTEEFAIGLDVDESGRVFVTGYTNHESYPTTAGAYDEDYNGGTSDIYVSRLDNNLSSLEASTFIGGSGTDEHRNDLAVDPGGNIVLLGSTGSDDYPTTASAYDTSFNDIITQGPLARDLCVTVLDSDLANLLASTYLGGDGFDRAYRLMVAGNGDVYVTGHTSSLDFPTTQGAFDDDYDGFSETFVSRFSNDLTQLLGSTYFTPDGAGGGYFMGMSVDTEGHLWLAGGSGQSGFPVTENAFDPTYNGGEWDAVLVQLSNEFDSLLYSTFFGGSGREMDASVALQAGGRIYLAGYTASSDFPTIGSGYDQSYNGNQDVYVAQFSTSMFSRVTSGPHVNTPGMAMGANLIDYDNDYYPDLFVPVYDGPNRLYRNNGDGSFSIPAGNIILADDSSISSGWGDFDNDGDLDAYMGRGLHERVANYYYVNNGDGSFTKNTSDIITIVEAASVDVICADYDNDGILDIFTPSSMFTGASNDQLFSGVGDGTFIQVTSGAVVEDETKSGGPLWIDFDDDGDQDLIVGKGGTSDVLFRNDSGEFTAITGLDFLVVESGQGFCAGDFDNDGDLDLFIPTWNGQNSALFENTGGGTFVRVLAEPMASDGLWSTGCCPGDFDNDGDVDIYIVNDNSGEDRPDYFYINDGTGAFSSFVDSALVDNASDYSCKATCADIDRDGDLDLYTVNWYAGEADVLFLNNGNFNNWITIKPVGTASNRSALGAKVRVLANIHSQGTWQMRELRSVNGARGQSPLECHFGLGHAAIVDSIKIEWPSGALQVLTTVPVNQYLIVEEDCCNGMAGNIDYDPDDIVDIGDLTALIDYLFISFEEPACMKEANVDGTDPVDIGDLTALIDFLFISFTPPTLCL